MEVLSDGFTVTGELVVSRYGLLDSIRPRVEKFKMQARTHAIHRPCRW